ncbi:MAG: CBS domain-containing protein [Desulforhopalus sp.]
MEQSKSIKKAIHRKYPAIGYDASLEEAMRSMAEYSSSALVVKSGGDLVGIVTINDVMYSLSNGHDTRTTLVSSFMTACDLITSKSTQNPCAQLDEDAHAFAAIKVMYEAGVNHLLVAGAGKEPVGMVSSLDIIKLLVS